MSHWLNFQSVISDWKHPCISVERECSSVWTSLYHLRPCSHLVWILFTHMYHFCAFYGDTRQWKNKPVCIIHWSVPLQHSWHLLFIVKSDKLASSNPWMKEQNILVLKFGFFDPLKKMELLGKFVWFNSWSICSRLWNIWHKININWWGETINA